MSVPPTRPNDGQGPPRGAPSFFYPESPLVKAWTSIQSLPLLTGGGLIPCCSPSFCPHHDCKDIGKVPLTRHGVKDASTDREQIAEWVQQWPQANVGLTGLVVIDVDNHPDNGRDGLRHLTELCNLHADADALTAFGELVQVSTGGGGYHFWALPGDDPVPRSKDKIASGIEVRGIGSYCMFPPSGHLSGREYRFLNDLRIPKALPDWFAQLARSAKPPRTVSTTVSFDAAARREPAEAERIVITDDPASYLETAWNNAYHEIRSARSLRNDTINAWVYGLARYVIHGYFLEDELRELAREATAPHVEAEMDPLSRTAVSRTIDSAIAGGKLLPKVLVDLSGAEIAPMALSLTGPQRVPNVQIVTGPREEEGKDGPLSASRYENAGQDGYSEPSRRHEASEKPSDGPCKAHDIDLPYVGPAGTLVLHIHCERKACPIGRPRWAQKKLEPVKADFAARPIFRITLANDQAWNRYRAQFHRLAKKQEVLHYPVRVGKCRREVLTTHPPSSSHKPLKDPLVVLYKLLMRSKGRVRPSPTWGLPERIPQGFTRIEDASRQLVLLVLEDLGYLSHPLAADSEGRNAWRIALYCSPRTVRVTGSRGVSERIERVQEEVALRVERGRCGLPHSNWIRGFQPTAHEA